MLCIDVNFRASLCAFTVRIAQEAKPQLTRQRIHEASKSRSTAVAAVPMLNLRCNFRWAAQVMSAACAAVLLGTAAERKDTPASDA